MAKRGMTAAKMTANWVAGMDAAGAAGGAYEQGINATQINPMAAAAANPAKWAAAVAASQPRWVARLTSPTMTIGYWKAQAIAKGVTNGSLTAGANLAGGANGRYTGFANSFYQYELAGLANLGQKGSYAQNKARLSAYLDYLHAYKTGNQLPAGA